VVLFWSACLIFGFFQLTQAVIFGQIDWKIHVVLRGEAMFWPLILLYSILVIDVAVLLAGCLWLARAEAHGALPAWVERLITRREELRTSRKNAAPGRSLAHGRQADAEEGPQ
jgi:hypothetical protein